MGGEDDLKQGKAGNSRTQSRNSSQSNIGMKFLSSAAAASAVRGKRKLHSSSAQNDDNLEMESNHYNADNDDTKSSEKSTTSINNKKTMKKKSKSARRREAEEAEEQRLTASIFGTTTTTFGSTNTTTTTMTAEQQTQKQGTFDRTKQLVVTATTKKNTRTKCFEQKNQDGGYDEDEGDEELLFEIDRTGVDPSTSLHPNEDDDSINGKRKGEHELTSAWSKALDENDDVNDDDNRDASKLAAASVWVDDEDAQLQVNMLETDRLRKLRTFRDEPTAAALDGAEFERRMRQRYQSTMARTANTDWADLSTVPAMEDKNKLQNKSSSMLLSSSKSLLRETGKRRLEPNSLDVVRCPDVNLYDVAGKAVTRVVQFHPGSDPERPLVFTAGFDKTLRFYQVGGAIGGGNGVLEPNSHKKIHSVHFPNFPIYSASFLGTTGNVVATSRRPYFFIYDAVAGKVNHIPKIVGREEKSWELCTASPDGKTIALGGNDGYIVLFDARCKQWITNLKLNGSVRTIRFAPQGQQQPNDTSSNHQILASGSDGDLYRWDFRQSRKCLERFPNLDGTPCSALAVSSQHIAVGSHSGVVNLYHNNHNYDHSTLLPGGGGGPEPIKSIMNLQSKIHLTEFNHDGQILAMGTNMERGQASLKFVHVPTATVFANWPTAGTPLNYVWSLDFSPQSHFVAIGNDKGKCLLYRLNHYALQ